VSLEVSPKRVGATLILMLGIAAGAASQVAPAPDFWGKGSVQMKAGRGFVQAYHPHALAQALDAIGGAFGWVLDYEEPLWGGPDLVEDTDPALRSAHPNDRFRREAGGYFRADFTIEPDMGPGSHGEERVLEQPVADYAASGNPGRFKVEREIDNRYAIVGVGAKDDNGHDRDFTPVLDAMISLSKQERNMRDTISLIAQLVSQKSGYLVLPGGGDANLEIRTMATIGGDERPAREFLAQLLSAAPVQMEWRVKREPDWRGGLFFLNLQAATHQNTDGAEVPLRSPVK
jgi:hypothetical protein